MDALQPRRLIPGSTLAWCLCLLGVPAAFAQVDHNPGYDRPGLGFTPAVLRAGDVTWEQGAPDWSRADGASDYNADTLLRLGLGRAFELQLGGGWNWLDAPGYRLDGRSSTSVAMKFAPAATGDFSWGLLGSVEFTDGARAFRASRRQYLLGASCNWQRGPDRSLGLYAEAFRGDVDGQLLAVNEGWALHGGFGVYAELAVQHASEVGYGSLAGAGVTWQLTPRVQLDLSARHRLAGRADTWQGGLGFAVYFGD